MAKALALQQLSLSFGDFVPFVLHFGTAIALHTYRKMVLIEDDEDDEVYCHHRHHHCYHFANADGGN